MFCPHCGAEYIEGFSVCSECKVDLIEQLEVEPEHPGFREVLRTYNVGDVAFIKSLLESEDIEFFVQGEHFMSMRPLIEPVWLMVREDQFERAVDLLKDADLSFKAIDLDRISSDEEA